MGAGAGAGAPQGREGVGNVFPAADVLPPEDGLEINLAVDELLGLRGPLSVIFRNCLFLLVFLGAFITLFGFVPHMLGKGAQKLWELSVLTCLRSTRRHAAIRAMQTLASNLLKIEVGVEGGRVGRRVE